MSSASKPRARESVRAPQSEQSVPFLKGCSGIKHRGICRLFPDSTGSVSHALKGACRVESDNPEHWPHCNHLRRRMSARTGEPAVASNPSETTLGPPFQAESLGARFLLQPPACPQLPVSWPSLPHVNSSLTQVSGSLGGASGITCASPTGWLSSAPSQDLRSHTPSPSPPSQSLPLTRPLPEIFKWQVHSHSLSFSSKWAFFRPVYLKQPPPAFTYPPPYLPVYLTHNRMACKCVIY